MSQSTSTPSSESEQALIRGIGLAGATSLNMIDMIGVGPFITIPLIVAAMGGPQAIIGWIAGALLAMCDGLVWAELGATYPNAGGSYRYLKEIYHPDRAGRFLGFLFIWQLTFSAPLSIASGCIGLSQYAIYLYPPLGSVLAEKSFIIGLPVLGQVGGTFAISAATLVAIAVCLLAVAALYRRIPAVERISKFLWIGVLGTVGWILVAGLTHFNGQRAFSFPPGAFDFSTSFFTGLGAGMLVATYDFWGYYNICFLGGEVRNPSRTIPRAILISIALVAVIYLAMNISILGVIPWQEIAGAAAGESHRFIVSTFMERIYGSTAGTIVTVLIMWTAFASVFSLLLGYSRVPYAAALEGDYFKPFGRLHPAHRFPAFSLVTLGLTAALFCTLRLADVIAALVVIRIVIQFLTQTAGLIILRTRQPETPRPFRMWLYPIPAVVAFVGFLAILVMRNGFLVQLRYALFLAVAGTVVYLLRARKARMWPFRPTSSAPPTSP